MVDRVVVEVPKTVKTDFSSTTFREVWDFEVEDLRVLMKAALENPLLMKYLDTNAKEIGRDVRGKFGIREIPGIRIFSRKI